MASSSVAGSAKSLGESRAEALQALLDSLAPSAEPVEGEKLGSEQARRISDKLGELLGDDVLNDMEQRNEKGELVNEEGLPIIDIVEPVHDGQNTAGTPSAFQDTDLVPLSALSDAEKARRRAERDRILDILEEEERIEQEKEEAEERKRFTADLEKRKQAANAELDVLKQAREMQKRMGKALLRNLADARERDEKERRAQEEADTKAREERKKLKPRKSVSFADLPPDHDDQPGNNAPSESAWGDTTPTKPHNASESPLLTPTKADRGPMRMNVVERVPGLRGPKSPPPPTQPDSDDESDPGTPGPEDSDEEVVDSDQSDTYTSPPLRQDNTDESDYGVMEDVEPIEWDDEGYDFAQHQREIALAYYEKRATIGAEALAAMRNHHHAADESEWDQPLVPLDATLASPPPKPAASRFKSSLSPGSSSLPSQSLGGSVLPASQSSTLKNAVRLGSLENGNLVGGEEGESDDEMDPAAKELLELLKKGHVMNVGPDPPSNSAVETTTPVASVLSTSDGASPRSKLSKVSQLKLAMATPSTSPHSPASTGSRISTPVTSANRSSPKLPSPHGTPITVPTKTKRDMASASLQQSLETRPLQLPGMIVDSLSFPGIEPTPGAAFRSVVIESPSFHSPASSTLVGTSVSNVLSPSSSIPSPPTSLSASVLERKPIGASEVRESDMASRPAGSTPVKEKKVSRFLAERT